jgi:hypothetical protein
METIDFGGVLQTLESLFRDPKISHAAVALAIGAAIGLLSRIIFKMILLYLASVTVLFIALKSFDLVNVQIDPEGINAVFVQIAESLRRFSLPQHTLFLGGIFVGFRYGLFGWLKR